jgi:hypothetical protein
LRARGGIALGVGLATAIEVWVKMQRPGGFSDFDHIWEGARIVWARGNPYELIGPGRAFDWPWPLYYPLPALLVVLPLTLLPLPVARALFTGGSTAILAWALGGDGFARLALLLSVPFLHAVQIGQWSPLLTAMFLLPALGWLAVAKPNIGTAVLAATPSPRTWRVAALGGGALVLASLILQPSWPADWLRTLRSGEHIAPPILRFGGPVLLLALLRWRRPEARLLLALGCVPQTPAHYEALPVLLVACRAPEVLGLVLLSDLALVTSFVLAPGSTSLLESATLYGRIINLFYYLPALALVLTRPNEGPAPAWLERLLGIIDRMRGGGSAVGASIRRR